MTIRMARDISHAKCEHFTRHPTTKRNVKHLDGAMYLRNETSNTWMVRRTSDVPEYGISSSVMVIQVWMTSEHFAIHR